MKHFYDLSQDDLSQWLKTSGHPAFRQKQIEHWAYNRGARSFSEMKNLGAHLQKALSEAFSLSTLTQEKMTDSGDGETYKFLWRLFDGKLVESVLIESGKRRTICVSSQVGCPARCAFCASGKKGLFRNLSASEIVEQFVQVNAYLAERGESLTHVVFMGMGEPLENYDAVVGAIRILQDKLGLSSRKITLSTVGVAPAILQLAEDGIKVNLALSLHAPTQDVRKKIIPYARKYPLEEVLLAVRAYAKETKRDITYEYTLIEGYNADVEHAEALVKLVKKDPCTVNLIPYNPVEGLRLARPSAQDIRKFRSVLEHHGINNTCRWTKGDDIAAACGQLALQEAG